MKYSKIYFLLFTGFCCLVSCKDQEEEKTIPYETVSDFDGNNYKTVKIGTQVWMAENLKTTKYKDGTVIPLASENTAWNNLTTPAYCWYNNDVTTNKNIYGALYNWYAVNTGKLCPTGWHVPSDEEWTILTTYLGGETVAGGKLKETGTSHWSNPNAGATNVSGFSALPGGARRNTGIFYGIGSYGNYWSSSEFPTASAWLRAIYFDVSDADRDIYDKPRGFSVRCLQD